MEITGKVIKILPLATGEGKNGTWKKQEFIIEVPGQFAKKVCFSLWGDNIQQNPIAEGEEITVFFDLESREYNNRWYTEARSWRITKPSGQSPETTEQSSFDMPGEELPGSAPAGDIRTDDLPF